MNETAVPEGWRLAFDPGLRRTDDGTVLIGGSPLRIVKLTAAGAALVDRWNEGQPVAASGPTPKLARRLLDAGMMYPKVPPLVSTDITVVVAVKDDCDGLVKVLAGLGDRPVIVVDDGSADAESIRTIAASAGARLMRRASSGGPGPARNTGLIEVTTEFVLFVDADVQLDQQVTQQLRGHFVDPSVVAVAPRVRTETGPSVRERYEATSGPLDLGSRPGVVGPGKGVPYVPTAALMVRVSAMRAIGGFDQGLRFGEDVDAVWRLASGQGVVRYDPHIEVWHRARSDWSGWLAQRFNYGSSAAPLGERHGAAVAPARLSPWSAVAWGLLVTGHPGPGVAIAAASSAALIPKLDSVAEPGREAARLAGMGHLWAGHSLARAAWRTWSPVLAVLSAFSKRVRRVSMAAALIPALVDWQGGPRDINPARAVALRVADDVAYASGVWAGVLRTRKVRALLPDLVDWPGRRRQENDHDSTTEGGSVNDRRV